eukprot:gene9059-biopygen7946
MWRSEGSPARRSAPRRAGNKNPRTTVHGGNIEIQIQRCATRFKGRKRVQVQIQRHGTPRRAGDKIQMQIQRRSATGNIQIQIIVQMQIQAKIQTHSGRIIVLPA